jgi:uncharacterized protein
MRYWFVLALAVPSLLLVSACGAGSTVVNTTPADQSGITVSGHGEVQAPADTATIDVGVQVTAANVGDARDRAAKSADAVISSIKKNGVDDADIKTIGLSIQPQYQYTKDNEPRITGYVVSNTVEAKIRKLDNLSKLVDDAVSSGGNDARFQGIRFSVEDRDKVIQQAREAAMNDAKAKADQLAKLGGLSLDKPITINETQSTPPTAFALATADKLAAGAAPSTPIQPGTSAITVDLQVRWSVK